jgi:hypothetical protein
MLELSVNDRETGRGETVSIEDPHRHALHPETLMLNYGYDPRLSEGAVKPPVFLTSTFVFRTAEDGKDFSDFVAGRREPPDGMGAGLVYSRFSLRQHAARAGVSAAGRAWRGPFAVFTDQICRRALRPDRGRGAGMEVAYEGGEDAQKRDRHAARP